MNRFAMALPLTRADLDALRRRVDAQDETSARLLAEVDRLRSLLIQASGLDGDAADHPGGRNLGALRRLLDAGLEAEDPAAAGGMIDVRLRVRWSPLGRFGALALADPPAEVLTP